LEHGEDGSLLIGEYGETTNVLQRHRSEVDGSTQTLALRECDTKVTTKAPP